MTEGVGSSVGRIDGRVGDARGSDGSSTGVMTMPASNIRVGGRIRRVNQRRMRCLLGIGRVGWSWCVQVECNWRGRSWVWVGFAR